MATAPAPASDERGGRGTSGGGGGSGSSGGGGDEDLLADDELRAIEAAHREGMTAVQIIDAFVSRRIRFSEATFRKYVQQGLLPRSRRVGRKGKHRGSLGVYPAKTVRRINAVKRLMADNYTIEEIQRQFLRFSDVIETLEEGITEVFVRLDAEVAGARFDTQTRRSLQREVAEARRVADDLLHRLDGLARRMGGPSGDGYRPSGASGAEELL